MMTMFLTELNCSRGDALKRGKPHGVSSLLSRQENSTHVIDDRDESQVFTSLEVIDA